MNVSDFYPVFLASTSCTIDSRKVELDGVFFAFSGENFNAATQARSAIESGAKAVIIEDIEFEDLHNRIYYVPSTLKFLQELAAYHRSQLNIPIIGLTGSNGKTTTKELMTQVLSMKFRVQSTVGNFNNHIGVPLTLLSIRDEHEIAVVEMGANHKKEIEFLCSISRPTLGYITNFGKAHLEGFGGFQGVIEGKSELYHYLRDMKAKVLVNEADPLQRENSQGIGDRITFGSAHSDYIFDSFEKGNFIGLSYNGTQILSQLTGSYNFTNLSSAVALGLYFDIDISDLKQAIESYVPSNMRSQVIQREGQTLVLDTYNANPSSMSASLENFSHFSGSKTVILGDMLELGEESLKEHQVILELAYSKGFDKIITVGPQFLKVNEKEAYNDTSELKMKLIDQPLNSDNILLKGSRGIALEKLLDVL